MVADICAGSGTTAVAALNTGRRFICFENALVFYDPATERIEQAQLAVAGGGWGWKRSVIISPRPGKWFAVNSRLNFTAIWHIL